MLAMMLLWSISVLRLYHLLDAMGHPYAAERANDEALVADAILRSAESAIALGPVAQLVLKSAIAVADETTRSRIENEWGELLRGQ